MKQNPNPAKQTQMEKNLTKKDLISAVAEKTNLSKKQVEEAINATFESITEGLLKGKKFTMKGFGTFKVNARKTRPGTNPQTGEPIIIPGKLVAKFKAGSKLSEALESAESISNWVNK